MRQPLWDPRARKLQSTPFTTNAQGRAEPALHSHVGLLSFPLDSITDRSSYFRQGPRPPEDCPTYLEGYAQQPGAPSSHKQAAESRAPHEASATTQATLLLGSPRTVMDTAGQGVVRGYYACGSRTGCYRDYSSCAIWNRGLTARTVKLEFRNLSTETHCFTI